VSNDDRPPALIMLAAQPLGDTPHEAEKRFTAVRRSRWIAQPNGRDVRLVRPHVIERAPAPGPVVAIAQCRLCGRGQLQRCGGLPGPLLRAGPELVGICGGAMA